MCIYTLHWTGPSRSCNLSAHVCDAGGERGVWLNIHYSPPRYYIYIYIYVCEKDSEAVLGVWLPAPLPTPRALPDHGALWPLAVGVEKDLGGIDV